MYCAHALIKDAVMTSIIHLFDTRMSAITSDPDCFMFFIGINFFHLLFLTLIPLTASLAGRYEEDQLAVLMFLSNIWLCGLSIAMISQYIVNKTEWHEKESAEQFLKQHWLYRYSATVAVIPVIIVSFFSHDVALYMCLGFPVVTMLVIRRK